jgi:hypothetical protein
MLELFIYLFICIEVNFICDIGTMFLQYSTMNLEATVWLYLTKLTMKSVMSMTKISKPLIKDQPK